MNETTNDRDFAILQLAFRRTVGRIAAVMLKDGRGRVIEVPVPAKLQTELAELVASADGEPEELTTL